MSASTYNTNKYKKKPSSEVFCQSCGSDVNFTPKDIENREFCECGDGANVISSWAAKDGHMIHIVDSLNYLFIGEDLTIQSSSGKNLYYEL
jgi:hypothetical protein